MRTTVEGDTQFVGQFTRLKGAGPDVVHDFVGRVTLAIHREAVRGIQRGPASGRFYKSSVSNAQHQASAIGEYPMSDSGYLASMIKFELPIKGTAKPVGVVGTNVPYGAILELKAPSRGGRPWLSRAIKVVMRNRIDKLLDNAFKRAAKNNGK